MLLVGTQCSECLWAPSWSHGRVSRFNLSQRRSAHRCSSETPTSSSLSRKPFVELLDGKFIPRKIPIGLPSEASQTFNVLFLFLQHQGWRSAFCAFGTYTQSKLMMCLHLCDERLHQAFANEIGCFLRACSSFASWCGSAFNKISSFQQCVAQCGQQAASEVHSILLQKGKIIRKEACAHGDIWRGRKRTGI